jgi:hypothetical protein
MKIELLHLLVYIHQMAERRGLHIARGTVSSIQNFLVVEKVAIIFFKNVCCCLLPQ